jgi:DeoR/GlpR family transcriptional regulator of sugar metabolism
MMCDDCSDVIVLGGTLAVECQSIGNKLAIRDLEKVCAEYCTAVLCSMDT